MNTGPCDMKVNKNKLEIVGKKDYPWSAQTGFTY